MTPQTKSHRNPFWLGLLFVIFLSACTDQKKEASVSVFHEALIDDVKTLDPAVAYDIISWKIVPQIYETLYQYHYLKEPYEVIPLLAADMPKYSKDGLTVTIPLKKGVRFHNDKAFPGEAGREVTAQDFIYAFKRLALPSIKSPGFWIFDGRIKGMKAFQKNLLQAKKENHNQVFRQSISGLRAIDRHTLQIQLEKPYPQLLYMLSLPFTAPVPEEAVKTYGDEDQAIHDHPIGTGPYRLESWVRGNRLTLDRNPHYHPEFYPTQGNTEFRKQGLLKDAGKTLPLTDRLVFEIIKEDQPAWLRFLKGEFEISLIPKDNFQGTIVDQIHLNADLKKKGIQLNIHYGGRITFLALNMKDPILGKNQALRQAISSAIDRKKFIELFHNGRGRTMVSALPPGLPGRPKQPALKYSYNLSRAKELMAKAGWANPDKPPLTVSIDMRGSDSLSRQKGEFFAQQLKAIGIDLKVIYNTFPAFLEKVKHSKHQIAYSGWTLDYPDAENVYQLLYGPNRSPGPNDANFSHKEFDQLYLQMAALPPSVERNGIIQKMDQILQEESPWVFLYYPSRYRLSQPWLKNYRADSIIINAHKYYRVDRAEKMKRLEALK